MYHPSPPSLSSFPLLLPSPPSDKNVPQPNLKHVPLANVVPLMEGEGSPSPPLRAGSDSDLPGAFAHYNHSDMLDGVEVGPNLRMAKSSSLESLQTVLHHSINPDGPRGLRYCPVIVVAMTTD